jgi:phosphatidylglycerophosphate synthase
MNNISKILEYRLDDKLTAFILDHAPFFKYVSPNLLTISGLIFNFIILYLMISGIFFGTSMLLLIRYLLDCLDGGVARKYNKKSSIGGALDTWSDTILIYISIYGLFYLYKIPYGSEAAGFTACFNMYIMSLSNSLVDHVGMKSGRNLPSKVYAFLVNNSFILFALKIFALSCVLL